MDHSGAHRARIQQWDGSKWSFTSDWIEADYKYLRPKVDQAAKDYGTQKNITARDCSKES
jgi:branched-chain amino acid transport system substrate-binding protein